MTTSKTDRPAARLHDHVVDWLGAQGALMLSLYMCAIIALIAFVIEAVG
ncbi:hypothetical protein [Sphingopyxis sp. KK2]|nr:hypothetical protein [Sphingopyxis sp. KK2]